MQPIRPTSILITGAFLVLLLGTSTRTDATEQATKKPASVNITLQKLSNSVYMLNGRGGNLGVSVGADGVVLIDAQFDNVSQPILDAIARISSEPVRLVLNTHWHGDHTGGNLRLAQHGAIIVAQDNVRQRLTQEQFMKLFKRRVKVQPRRAWPVITFSQNITLHFNGDTLAVEHPAHAHTDGDAYVHFVEDNIIHTGDLYFSGRFPFIDVDSGGSLDGMIAATGEILALADDATRIIPGHGPLSNRAELGQYRQMLITVRERLRALARHNTPVDEVVKAKPLTDMDARWGRGFIRADALIRLVYPQILAQID